MTIRGEPKYFESKLVQSLYQLKFFTSFTDPDLYKIRQIWNSKQA